MFPADRGRGWDARCLPMAFDYEEVVCRSRSSICNWLTDRDDLDFGCVPEGRFTPGCVGGRP